MKYKAICYLSNIKPSLNKGEIDDLMDFSVHQNNKRAITGLCILLDNHFYQILEGEPNAVDELFSKIKKDNRHNGLIKLIDKPIKDKIFAEYYGGDFAIVKKRVDVNKLKIYLEWLKNANIPEINELLLLTENFLKYNNGL
ncbi:BLUF domain-containing protein [Tamlana crocina]|uniref:BLUF domain-containing protein n=1 Tax=Tamlana crocina TaxID=393006 RepID=A0ABX1DCS1_9FLAO|nr:BLUF domain-containing protein [Tamlana crocina]NJX16164.1 BLUF domain-containing protein [Tamlana crocina]